MGLYLFDDSTNTSFDSNLSNTCHALLLPFEDLKADETPDNKGPSVRPEPLFYFEVACECSPQMSLESFRQTIFGKCCNGSSNVGETLHNTGFLGHTIHIQHFSDKGRKCHFSTISESVSKLSRLSTF